MSAFTIENVLLVLTSSLNRIIVFLVLAATAVFLWGVVRYISAGGDEEKTQAARSIIIYGIISLMLMIAVWGFVYIVVDFIFGTETIPKIPGGDVVDTI